MVLIKASDGATFELSKEAAMVSGTIRRMMERGDDSVLSLDLDAEVLAKVIEYCNKHGFASSDEISDDALATLNQWDADFMKEMTQALISGLISASVVLDVKGLLLLSICKKILTLISQDNQEFIVEAEIAMMVKFIEDWIHMEPMSANRPILLHSVPARGLYPVIEYCRKHSWAEKEGLSKDDIMNMDAEFVKENLKYFFDIVRAAAYLQAENLLKLAVEAVGTLNEFAGLSLETITCQICEQSYTKQQEKAMVAVLSAKYS